MNEWTVVTVIIALVGLFLTVGNPIIKLNSNIVKLNLSVDALREKTDAQASDLKDFEAHAHESHRRLWEHNDKQDKQLAEHEARIIGLEKK